MIAGILLAAVLTVSPGRGTLEKAVAEAVAAGGGEIILQNGTYELAAPLKLGPEATNLVFRAATNARPCVSAGLRIRDWRVCGDGVWRARVPAGVRFSQFYVNGERRERPFLPRKGYWRIDGAAKQDEGAKYHPRVKFPEGSIRADWPDLTNVEIRVFHNWSNTRMNIAAVDEAKREVLLAGVTAKACSDNALTSRFWFRAENVRAAFGEEGDWYLTPGGELWYKPIPGEKIENTQTIAACHPAAVLIEGACDVRFEGIIFSYADHSIAKGGRYCGQAGFFLPGAVHATHAQRIVFERCAFTHVGAFGLVFAENCHNCVVRDSEFCDLGAGGVRIGNGSFEAVHPPDASSCVIEDCLIAHGGRVEPVAAGIWIGNASSNRVSHCTIYDHYYSGISCGWDWGLKNRRSHHNILEFNHIYDIGQKVLSDLGGIYTLAQQPGTVLRGNYVHDVSCSIYMGVGIYLDECSSMIVATNNFIRDVETGFFLQNTARSNYVARNVMAVCEKAAVPFATGGVSPLARLNHVEDNVMHWTGAQLVRNFPPAKSVAFARNRCWREPPQRKTKVPAGFELAEVDVASFLPVQAGKRTPNFLTAKIRTRCAFEEGPNLKSALKCEPYREDFENVPPGKFAPSLMPFPAKTTGLAVTAETSYSGKHCYKIVDGMKPEFGPHVCKTVNRTNGLVRVTFALRCEKGSQPQFELRQCGWSQAPFGPAVSVWPNGTLITRGGDVITKLQHGAWYKITLSFVLGAARKAAVFDVTVLFPDGSERTWKGFDYDEAFEYMVWLGFMSGGAPGTTYYIDDISVE